MFYISSGVKGYEQWAPLRELYTISDTMEMYMVGYSIDKSLYV